ncbi:MAG: UDP-N-acetylglucosamine 1-carboxyvinyltransferase [Clostridia bacterium]|nr:UDP-N-acetylglucosamine 1-carboxyvinyltransferase [Clostridia bacterium]
MRRLSIYGGKPLRGEVRIQGAKNAALPILAATLLTDETCEIRNCPDLTDIHGTMEILESLGARVSYDGRTATVCAAGADGTVIAEELMCRMRSSVIFLGSMLSRNGKARISYPGGCALGARPIDLHLDSMRRLGVEFYEEEGCICGERKAWKPQTVTLMFPSVGATENLLLLCAVSQGETLIVNPAREPEIVDLQNFLNCMGADIRGAGSDTIRIRGVSRLHGCSYTVIPDRIVAATYACAVTACGGDVLLHRAEPMHLCMFLTTLKEMGAQIDSSDQQIRVRMHQRPMAVRVVKTLPYPGFPTDIQPLLMAALLRSVGTTVFTETIFENRFKHVGEFLRMGAEIRVENMNAVVRGVPELHGAKVEASDLRGGAALAIAGLSARGRTSIGGLCYMERGYENLETHLRSLGADAEITED